MSPRAAWRLQRYGFDARDYSGGKMDWLSNGLPYEGEADLVGRHLSEAPVCQVDEAVGDVRSRLGGEVAGCVVLDGDLVVGVLPRQLDDAATAADAMVFGVTTVRPSEEREQLDQRMARAGVDRVVVTTSTATLLGVYHGG